MQPCDNITLGRGRPRGLYLSFQRAKTRAHALRGEAGKRSPHRRAEKRGGGGGTDPAAGGNEEERGGGAEEGRGGGSHPWRKDCYGN